MNSDKILGLKTLKVKYHDRPVGTLALTKDGKAAFSYEKSWLDNGFSISPFSLPLEDKVFVPERHTFGGLFGIFADSLPDAWGQLLLERTLKAHGITSDITILDRLAFVGSSGMGALEYEPDYDFITDQQSDNLDYIAAECKKVFETEYNENIDLLYRMGGSSGGARPKILTRIDNSDWLVKFPAHVDSPRIGLQEYQYALCAKSCGITMTEVRLMPSGLCDGYFATKRFDRETQDGAILKIHMATAAALLEADFRTPCLDYNEVMKLTRILTKDNHAELTNMFRRMCFNVFAHNRDDHAKNFSFLYDETLNRWAISPAYDLTFSSTYYGEHTTSVDGNGANPGEKELLNVGLKAGLSKNECLSIISKIRELVQRDLKQWM